MVSDPRPEFDLEVSAGSCHRVHVGHRSAGRIGDDLDARYAVVPVKDRGDRVTVQNPTGSGLDL